MMKKGMPKITAEEKKSLFRDLESIFEDGDNAVIIVGLDQKGGSLRFFHASAMDAIIGFGIMIAEMTAHGDLEVDEIIDKIREVAESAKGLLGDTQKGGRAS